MHQQPDATCDPAEVAAAISRQPSCHEESHESQDVHTVRRGQTITFHNRGKVTHNAKGEGFFSRVVEPGGTLKKGQSKSVKLTQAGTLAYPCEIHPFMKATVIVT